ISSPTTFGIIGILSLRTGSCAARTMRPLDREWLGTWIRAEHLDPARIATRRHQFTACPPQPLVIPGFLPEPLAGGAGVCLRGEVARRVVYGLHSRAVHDDVSEAEWLSAPRGDRSYRFCVIASPAPEHRLSRHLAGFLKLRQALSDPRFSRFIEQ